MHEMTLQELYNVGLHFGHKKEHSTPMVRPYIYGVRDGICIFNLEKTLSQIEEALVFLKESAASGKTILFVGTKKQARPLVTSLAKSLDMPYVTNRWYGGLLTNFTTVRKSLDNMAELEKFMQSPEFKQLKKREQNRIAEKAEKLHRSFDGIKNMTKLPDIMFVIDERNEDTAIKEAEKLGITVVATVDTNGDPTNVDMVIPCNDDAPRGLKYLLQRIGEAVAEGKGETFTAPEDLEVDTSIPVKVKKAGGERVGA